MLTQKQYELLCLIDEHTKWEGDTRPGSKLTLYWVPGDRWTGQYVYCLKKSVVIGGSGNAAMIRGFIRKGLVTSIPRMNPYACAITEEGLIALERYREKYVYEDGRIPA